MEQRHNYSSTIARFARVFLVIALCASFGNLMAQDTTKAAPTGKKKSYVKNTFDGNYIIDNQTVMVPIKGTFEFDIQHRFGVVSNGTKDLFGIFASATMKLGVSYTPVSNLQFGFDGTNESMIVDGNIKFAL